MGRVATQARLPHNAARTPFERDLLKAVETVFRDYGIQINYGTEGRIAAYSSATDVKPTNSATPGDFAPNIAPVRMGTVGSEYVILGWRYTTAGVWEAITELVD